jgi:hypothetical protein
MILVQNHLQPLSGNKFILRIKAISAFCLIMLSITVSRANNSVIPKDTSYKVAMILPFHLYNYFGSNVNRSNIMLDYYQGFYLALKEYEAKGLNLKLYVYDNEHDTTKTHEILAKPELKEMDLIISPILDEHLHIINHFSSKYQIPVISPFTAIDSLFPNNPLFFNAAPAEKTKAEIFYEYYRKTHPDKILVIIKDDEDWNKGFGPQLNYLLQTKEKINYRVVTRGEIVNADSNYLPKWKNYIVYHYAENSKDVKFLTTFLDKHKSTFEIVGDYKPTLLKNVPKAKRDKYEMKIISSDYTNPMDSAVVMRDFKTTYRSLYNFNPSRYSVIGHDQASFIADILLKYDRFRANDFVGESYQYYATKFLFKKDRQCNQNKGMFILKISPEDFLEEVKY